MYTKIHQHNLAGFQSYRLYIQKNRFGFLVRFWFGNCFGSEETVHFCGAELRTSLVQKNGSFLWFGNADKFGSETMLVQRSTMHFGFIFQYAPCFVLIGPIAVIALETRRYEDARPISASSHAPH